MKLLKPVVMAYSKLPKTTVGNCFDDGITRVYWYFNYTTS